jgi:hypothetical protein
VQGGHRYHKYYGGSYSGKVLAHGIDTTTLDGEYDRMIAAMRRDIRAAKDAHGRVGDNDHAQNLNVGP